MSKDIRIKKGLDIKLVGGAEKTTIATSLSSVYAIKPEDFHGIIPKLKAKEGSEVKAADGDVACDLASGDADARTDQQRRLGLHEHAYARAVH